MSTENIMPHNTCTSAINDPESLRGKVKIKSKRSLKWRHLDHWERSGYTSGVVLLDGNT